MTRLERVAVTRAVFQFRNDTRLGRRTGGDGGYMYAVDKSRPGGTEGGAVP